MMMTGSGMVCLVSGSSIGNSCGSCVLSEVGGTVTTNVNLVISLSGGEVQSVGSMI